MIAKYRSKVKEDKSRNVNNGNKHFDKSKQMHSEEQDWNENGNWLKHAQIPRTNGDRQIHSNYQKTTIATFTDHATAVHEDSKSIKCTTHPKKNTYLKTSTIFYPNTKTEHSRTREQYFSTS